MEAERKTLLEQVATAMNASVLRTVGASPNVETPLTRVAGMGAAALHIHHGADQARAPVSVVVANPAHVPDPRDVLAAQLASVLSHRRDALQGRISVAIDLFAQWMKLNPRFAVFEDRDVLLPKLAAWALHEWLSPLCARCGGTGVLERLGNGTLVRGLGRMQRNAVFPKCTGKIGCGGSGRSLPSPVSRRLALGIDAQRYDKERWDRTFTVAQIWLNRLKGRIKGPLTDQLERSKKRD